MTSTSMHFPLTRRLASLAIWIDVLAALGAAGLGGWLISTGDLRFGLVLIGSAVAALVIGLLIYGQLIMLHKVTNTALRLHDATLDLTEMVRRQTEYTHSIAENAVMSDWAKRIVYREKDYEFLRDTIQAAIVRSDWEAAEHLIRDVDKEFGYREEAERLRETLAQARRATVEEKVAGALERFERLCSEQKWDQARDEALRLQTLYPDDSRITGLPRELDSRKQAFKRRLLQQYEQAVRTQDVDRAHRLLFQLDRYLAASEAGALKESARGIFKAKLQQMGVQFSLAVSDRQFETAIEIGQRLIREFPNSRYAREIAGMMPALQQRAQEHARDGVHQGA